MESRNRRTSAFLLALRSLLIARIIEDKEPMAEDTPEKAKDEESSEVTPEESLEVTQDAPAEPATDKSDESVLEETQAADDAHRCDAWNNLQQLFLRQIGSIQHFVQVDAGRISQFLQHRDQHL